MSQDQVQAQIVTVARAMFTNFRPEREWDNPVFQVDRDNCLMLAVQFREIFLRDAKPFGLLKAVDGLTEASCKLLFGDRPVSPVLRVRIFDFAESYIEDLSKLFGDTIVKDGHLYQPEQEPEHDSLEVVTEKATVN